VPHSGGSLPVAPDKDGGRVMANPRNRGRAGRKQSGRKESTINILWSEGEVYDFFEGERARAYRPSSDKLDRPEGSFSTLTATTPPIRCERWQIPLAIR